MRRNRALAGAALAGEISLNVVVDVGTDGRRRVSATVATGSVASAARSQQQGEREHTDAANPPDRHAESTHGELLQ
jgi:hypothetical protein